MRLALQKSKNLVSIRILSYIGTKYAQDYVTQRFGFDADKTPPYLPMALGAGLVTPLQSAGAYSVFANGGYRVNPVLISRITDPQGKILSEAKAPALDESLRVIEPRNAGPDKPMATASSPEITPMPTVRLSQMRFSERIVSYSSRRLGKLSMKRRTSFSKSSYASFGMPPIRQA